jgi:hypothetical protein
MPDNPQDAVPQTAEEKRQNVDTDRMMPGLVTPLVETFNRPNAHLTVRGSARRKKVSPDFVATALFRDLYSQIHELRTVVSRSMAKLERIGISVETVCSLQLNDEEVAALDALVGYGIESFLNVFYEKLGRAYLEPHEGGLRSLFKAVSGCKGLTDAAGECREFLQLVVGEERRKFLDSVRDNRRKLTRIA